MRGSIVNISSVAAARAHRQMAAYDATKGGMEAMTRSMAIAQLRSPRVDAPLPDSVKARLRQEG